MTSDLDVADNLMSTLVHEKFHKNDNQNPGFKSTLYTHVQVYAAQLNDPSFAGATESYQNGEVGSFANYIMNAAAEGYQGTDKTVDDFNKTNKLGYHLYMDTSQQDPADYKTIIYRNHKLVGTYKYNKAENED